VTVLPSESLALLNDTALLLAKLKSDFILQSVSVIEISPSNIPELSVSSLNGVMVDHVNDGTGNVAINIELLINSSVFPRPST
jgi:hypothetical protein